MAGPSRFKPAGRHRILKDGSSTSSLRGSGVAQRREERRTERARLTTIQTWSFQVLDEASDHEGPDEISLPDDHMRAQSELKPHSADLTSPMCEEAGKERLSKVGDERALSPRTTMSNSNTASLHPAHGNPIISNRKAHEASNTAQPSRASMAPVKLAKRSRVRYTDPPPVVLASPRSPSTAQPESPDQAPPSAEASPTLTHTRTHESSPLMIESVTTLPELTPDIFHPDVTLVSPRYESSSSASSEYDYDPRPPRLDFAVNMKGLHRGRAHRGRQTGSGDQEVIFRGRNSIGPSNNDTNDSWRWDSTLGALVSNTSGASYRPALASQSSNQCVAKEDSAPSATISAATADLKLQDSAWANEPAVHNQWDDKWDASGHDTWNAVSNGNADWGTAHLPLPTKTHGVGQNNKDHTSPPRRPFNHNGRVRIERKGNKPKESPWIKDSLIPKGDPKRHKMRWSSPSRETSSFDSDRPSSGWGTRKKRDGNGDGADLADWAGAIGPATLDWDSRARFRDHQSEAKIEAWLDRTLTDLDHTEDIRLASGENKFSFVVGLSGIRTLVDEEQGDVAPRYWLPTTVDAMTLDSFWRYHINNKNVEPQDIKDLEGAIPWWHTYVDSGHDTLQALVHPSISGMDPGENEAERLAREHDNGGAHAGENRKAAEKAKRDALRKRTLAKRAKAHKISATYSASNDAVVTNTIKPGLSMFIRSATKEDMIQVRDIYNRYIGNAFVVPETTRQDENDMLQRWQTVKNAGLPYIVACQRGEVIKARNKKLNDGEDRIMPDRVVGFAYAADWSDGTCIYRPTVKLGVFVHMEHYMKHIGDCLADKMMGLLDPSFVERGGYDTIGDDLQEGRPNRAISNILIRYSYEAERTEKLRWVSQWLRTHFGFEKVADLKGVAQKFDKQLNLAMLQKTIDTTTPTNPPENAD